MLGFDIAAGKGFGILPCDVAHKSSVLQRIKFAYKAYYISLECIILHWLQLLTLTLPELMRKFSITDIFYFQKTFYDTVLSINKNKKKTLTYSQSVHLKVKLHMWNQNIQNNNHIKKNWLQMYIFIQIFSVFKKKTSLSTWIFYLNLSYLCNNVVHKS